MPGRRVFLKGPEEAAGVRTNWPLKYYGVGDFEGQEPTTREFALLTWCHPRKGWAWRLVYAGEAVARSGHHVPTEVEAIRRATACLGMVMRQLWESQASDVTVIREDRWRDAAERTVAQQSLHFRRKDPGRPNRTRLPALLECGHIHLVRASHQLGSDQINCAACGTHKLALRFIEDGPALLADLARAPDGV